MAKKGIEEENITGIEYDSRKIKDGNLFVAIVGSDVDGHDYIDNAIKNGAKAVLVSKDIDDSNIDITLITALSPNIF